MEYCVGCGFNITKDCGGPVKYEGDYYHRFCLRTKFKVEAEWKKKHYAGSE